MNKYGNKDFFISNNFILHSNWNRWPKVKIQCTFLDKSYKVTITKIQQRIKCLQYSSNCRRTFAENQLRVHVRFNRFYLNVKSNSFEYSSPVLFQKDSRKAILRHTAYFYVGAPFWKAALMLQHGWKQPANDVTVLPFWHTPSIG